MQTLHHNDHAARIAGVLLMVTTLLSLVVMAHHPHVNTATLAEAVQQLAALEGASEWVHGILIALLLLIYWCLTEYSLRRGVEKPLVRAGLVFYGAGVVAMLGAAAIDGFVIGHIPGLVANPNDMDMRITAQLLNLSSLFNRTLADIGVVAMSAGILAWSVGLLHSAGWPRAVGVIGVLAGMAPALGLILGAFHLNVYGMMGVLLVQAVWNIALGALLVAKRL
jgi:hypothetical protein